MEQLDTPIDKEKLSITRSPEQDQESVGVSSKHYSDYNIQEQISEGSEDKGSFITLMIC